MQTDLPKVALSVLSVELAQVGSHIAAMLVAGAWIVYLTVKTRNEIRYGKKLEKQTKDSRPPL